MNDPMSYLTGSSGHSLVISANSPSASPLIFQELCREIRLIQLFYSYKNFLDYYLTTNRIDVEELIRIHENRFMKNNLIYDGAGAIAKAPNLYPEPLAAKDIE